MGEYKHGEKIQGRLSSHKPQNVAKPQYSQWDGRQHRAGGRGNNSGQAVKQQCYFPIFAPHDEEDLMTFLVSLTY